MTILTQAEKAHASKTRTRKNQLLSLFIALAFVLTICPTKAQAQIVGDLEGNIPFPFYVGNTKLPPGKYVIQTVDNTDLKVMEIRSADDSTTALFDVYVAEANQTPSKSELIFNKYGNRYFLEELFDEGSPSGTKVIESRYEKRVSQAAAEAQEHVAVHHRAHQGASGS